VSERGEYQCVCETDIGASSMIRCQGLYCKKAVVSDDPAQTKLFSERTVKTVRLRSTVVMKEIELEGRSL
jgi:hypothetical protein